MLIEKIPGIEGAFVAIGDKFEDARGTFEESWNYDKMFSNGQPINFKQLNTSTSVFGTLRGMHIQKKNPQGKLITAIHGEVWDVMVDVRRDSKTFKKWFAMSLSGKKNISVYCPPGCAHGFFTKSNVAIVQYLCTTTYDKASDSGIIYNDPTVAIEWPFDQNEFSPTMSVKDQGLPTLEQFLAEG